MLFIIVYLLQTPERSHLLQLLGYWNASSTSHTLTCISARLYIVICMLIVPGIACVVGTGHSSVRVWYTQQETNWAVSHALVSENTLPRWCSASTHENRWTFPLSINDRETSASQRDSIGTLEQRHFFIMTVRRVIYRLNTPCANKTSIVIAVFMLSYRRYLKQFL